MKFLIWAPGLSLSSGGSIALHRLGHNLSVLGHQVELYGRRKHPDWGGTVVKRPRTGASGVVTIYPEVVAGNPLSGHCVVRWILNTPGVCGGDGVFGERDLILLWSRDYHVDPKYQVSGELTAWRDWSHFRDLGGARKGTCYAVRKGTGKALDQHPEGALCIDNYGEKGGDDYLLRVFNEYETFYCYDDNTALVNLAALCGCRVLPEHLILSAPADRFETADRQTRELVELCQQQWPELTA